MSENLFELREKYNLLLNESNDIISRDSLFNRAFFTLSSDYSWRPTLLIDTVEGVSFNKRYDGPKKELKKPHRLNDKTPITIHNSYTYLLNENKEVISPGYKNIEVVEEGKGYIGTNDFGKFKITKISDKEKDKISYQGDRLLECKEEMETIENKIIEIKLNRDYPVSNVNIVNNSRSHFEFECRNPYPMRVEFVRQGNNTMGYMHHQLRQLRAYHGKEEELINILRDAKNEFQISNDTFEQIKEIMKGKRAGISKRAFQQDFYYKSFNYTGELNKTLERIISLVKVVGGDLEQLQDVNLRVDLNNQEVSKYLKSLKNGNEKKEEKRYYKLKFEHREKNGIADLVELEGDNLEQDLADYFQELVKKGLTYEDISKKRRIIDMKGEHFEK